MDWMGSLVNWQAFGTIAAKVTAAYVLALPIGWERERVQHSVGLRTFPLVAMASCGYVLLADSFGGGDVSSRSRIIQGLTTGIGFIGGGAIMRGRGNVHGTATAASIWNTGVIGAAIAESRIEIAVILSLLNLITLHLLVPRKERSGHAEPETKK
ncbi:MAG TPA: MgtC/SapB family protein [Bryobacteraceae bacterium]|jgi:putative Mg2+ transporter-C (MgtC) family protein|nr:MgtC/SapB family protein [Bryobacteraceae bacterium]